MVDLLPIKPPEGQPHYDLGWLIQNRRVSDEQFCSFLLDETSTEIARLVSRFLKSPADRIAAVDQIVFTMLLRRRSFKGTVSGRTWLYSLTFEECIQRALQSPLNHRNRIHQIIKAIDTHLAGEPHFNQFMGSLSDVQRLIVILHYGQNLAVEEIALLLKINSESVHTNLEQSRQKLMAHQHSCEKCSTLLSSLVLMETAISEALQTNNMWMNTARENREDWTGSLLRRLDREKIKQRTHQWVSRAAELSLGLFILVLIEFGFTNSWPVMPWSMQPTATMAVKLAPIEPTPQSTLIIPTPVTPATTMDGEKTMQGVLTLSLTSWARWNTLWADVLVKNYYIENYSDGSGSTLFGSLRKQIWLSPPGSSRVVSGEPGGNPKIAYVILNSQMTGQNYASGQMIDSSLPDLITDDDLKFLFSPVDMFSQGGRFTWMGNDITTGRPSWVVDWSTNGFRVYRYWIDQEYGIVLRRIAYAPAKFSPVVSDITVTKIFFNAPFPKTIFVPYYYKGDHFAYDFVGTPEIKDFKTALQTWSNPDIALSSSSLIHSISSAYANAQLSFQNLTPDYIQSPDGPGLELFAGQVDLGKLPLGGNSLQTCQRSPDGSQIAYNSPAQDGSGDSALFIADLASPQSARPVLAGGITSGDFAFSPDNRRLAFFGCEKATNFCGVFILDLTTWQLIRLTPLNYADYMVWSPDGNSIALVGKKDLGEAYKIIMTTNLLESEVAALLHEWNFQVIDARTGDATYKRLFEWSNLDAPSDSPTNSWNTPFKIPTGGVDGCINPPKKSGTG